VNDEHIFALVEAVDGTHLHAIQIFALYAIFHDHVGHTYILMSHLTIRNCARSLWISSILSAAMAQLVAFVGLFLK
jgi:hypothetical protein